MEITELNYRHWVLRILLFLIIFTSHESKAQDSIYTNSHSPLIIAKILEVNPSNLRYKSYSNIGGPTYTILRSEIDKVIYQNGDVEMFQTVLSEENEIERQISQNLIPGSRILLTFSNTEGKNDVDGNDAIGMLKSYIEGKTNCIVVNSIDKADFEMELKVVKKIMADRKAMLTIKHILTGEDVYTTKWVRGTSNAFSGYSGSRASIGKLVKKYLIRDYPEIAI